LNRLLYFQQACSLAFQGEWHLLLRLHYQLEIFALLWVFRVSPELPLLELPLLELPLLELPLLELSLLELPLLELPLLELPLLELPLLELPLLELQACQDELLKCLLLQLCRLQCRVFHHLQDL
jgi:hypothetical protein